MKDSLEEYVMIGLIGALIIGLIVGALARLIVPGKDRGGCLLTMVIGIAGSFVAFYLGRLLGWTSGHPDSLRPVGFIPSLIGAIILLVVYHLIRRRNRYSTIATGLPNSTLVKKTSAILPGIRIHP